MQRGTTFLPSTLHAARLLGAWGSYALKSELERKRFLTSEARSGEEASYERIVKWLFHIGIQKHRP